MGPWHHVNMLIIHFVLRVPLLVFIMVVIVLYNNGLCYSEKCEYAHNDDFLLDTFWSKSSALVTVAVHVVDMLSFGLY